MEAGSNSSHQPAEKAPPLVRVVAFPRPSYEELFITAALGEGQSVEAMFGRAAEALRESRAHVVSHEVFGISKQWPGAVDALTDAFGGLSWPVTWIEEGCENGGKAAGTQVWAVSGMPVEPVEVDGTIVGRIFEDEYAQYCRLGGLAPRDRACAPEEQTRAVFEEMDAALGSVGIEFRRVVRTWFFNEDILSWYREFNEVRDAFFRKKSLFDGLAPASTGMGGRNAAGAALMAGLLAVKPKGQHVHAAPVPSPLQRPALEYGSSFSRAVELAMPDHRRLLVSGTASIGPDGQTLHVGDVDAQIARTMDVVKAILDSRGMDWNHVCRAVAYFKRADDVDCFENYCARTGLQALPVVLAQGDICRDELLFEIEVDALLPCPP